MTDRVRNFLGFIRFSHTIFAMPFALGAMFVAARGLPSLRTFLAIILAMVFARTAAMLFNRLADWEIDKRNPRTVGRHKLVSHATATVACAASATAFIATAWFVNPLCFALSPVALAIIFFYSLTKRFTHFTQFFLGLALGVAPVGAWLAVTGHFAVPPLVLAVSVLAWVAGFDMIYASQDVAVDAREGLKSMVVWLGVPNAFLLAQFLHLLALAGFIAFGVSAKLGAVYFLSLAGVVGALVYEHLLARKNDVGAINRAFFQANAFIGLIFVISTLADQFFHIR
jgi:4-hydroxybenzoate polyprenyltransferase